MSRPASQPPPPEPTPETWASVRRVVGDGLLSILMPAHNLAPVIARNVATVRALFHNQVPFEIVVIDDGSTDGTGRVLTELAAAVPELHPLVLDRNVGKGAALLRGYEFSRGSVVVFLDGDLDLPPDQIPGFFEIMERQQVDVVIGSKQHPGSSLNYPWHRQVMSTLYYWLVKLAFGLPIHDTQTGLKVFRRRSLEWAFPRMLVKTYAFDLELLTLVHMRGHRIAEAPGRIEYQGGGALVRPRMIKAILVDTLAVFYRFRLLRYYQAIPDTHMLEPPPLVSIIIACPADSAYLREALDGIARQTYRNYEVILLPDRASGQVWPAGVREIPTGPVRPAQKRNLGLQHAQGEVIAFLDDDAFPGAEWLERALLNFSVPNVVAVGGPAVTPGNDPFLARLSGKVYESVLVSGRYRYRYWPTRVREVDDYPSCNFFVTAAAARELGGFRTDFWPGEDTYLCMEIVQKLHKRILYDPWAVVYHHRRGLFLPHLRQIGRYGLHRGYFARRFPATSRRIGYMLPSALVLGLVSGLPAAILCPFCRIAYLSALGLYAFLTLLMTFSRHPAAWLLTWLGVVLTHLVYGTRFLIGWFTRRLPSEVQKFDHPSEQDS